MRRPAAVGIALLLGGCATMPHGAAPGPDLSPLLAFADAGACQPAPVLDRLLHSLLRDTTARPVRYGPVEVADRFRAAVGPARLAHLGDTWEASAALAGTWLGLPVTSVAMRGYDGGDGAGFRFLFRASPLRTRAAAARAGFPLTRARAGWRAQVAPAGRDLSSLSCTANG